MVTREPKSDLKEATWSCLFARTTTAINLFLASIHSLGTLIRLVSFGENLGNDKGSAPVTIAGTGETQPSFNDLLFKLKAKNT